jgi:hypothetical protein
VVLYGYDFWPLLLKEEHRLKLFEKVLRRISEPKRKELQEVGESFITCTLPQVKLESSSQET